MMEKREKQIVFKWNEKMRQRQRHRQRQTLRKTEIEGETYS
jgi:hypothetical protein